MIGERFNFEDVFFRDLTVCVLDTLEGQVKWINRFSSGDRFVQVPFYYSLTGDERFLLDSFSDDIVSENRFIELNTDQIPRGHLTMTGFNIKSDEFANPNVWLRMVVENELEIRKILARVRAIPITVNYELEILLNNEVDTFKCSQALMDTMWIYKYMYFEHNFMNIDAVILMPDTNSIEMSREKNLSSDNNIKLKCSFTVETYYPSFRRDRVTQQGYPRPFGTGMKDSNGYSIAGGFSSFFNSDVIIPSNSSLSANNNNNNNTQNTNNTDLQSQTNQPVPSSATLPSGINSYNSLTANISNRNIRGGAGGQNFGQNLASLNQNQNSIPQQFTTVGGTESSVQNVTGPSSQNINSNNGLPGQLPFFDNQNIGGNSPFGEFAREEYPNVSPKRTRWFNNILRARERASGNINNPNSQDPNTQNDGDPPTT